MASVAWRAAREGGFTLLEVLVALIIAAIAAAVILSQVRTLMLKAEKEQAHQIAATQLLNDALRISPGVISADVRVRQDKDALIIEPAGSAGRETQVVRVSNFSLNNEKLPPIDLAYTPFQRFEIKRDRYSLSAIAPALKPPASGTSPATRTSP